MPRSARLLLHAAAILAAGVAMAGQAAADSTPAHIVTGRVSAGVIVAGGELSFGGTGFAPHAVVRITSEGTSLGEARTDASGGFVTSVTLTGSPGFRTIAGIGPDRSGGSRAATVTVRLVAADGARKPDDSEESTGLALLAGFGVVVLGAGGRLLRRRRRAVGASAWP